MYNLPVLVANAVLAGVIKLVQRLTVKHSFSVRVTDEAGYDSTRTQQRAAATSSW
jgi:hypothetical protein